MATLRQIRKTIRALSESDTPNLDYQPVLDCHEETDKKAGPPMSSSLVMILDRVRSLRLPRPAKQDSSKDQIPADAPFRVSSFQDLYCRRRVLQLQAAERKIGALRQTIKKLSQKP